jgi:glycerol-3-phosphate dehydrogenase
LAESAVKKLAGYMPVLDGQSWTLKQPLPGGDFPTDGAGDLADELQRAFPFLPASLTHRWVRSYGTLTRSILGHAKTIDDLGVHFGHGLYACEVDYLIGREWARSANDILWRRSKLGLRFSAEETQNLERYIVGKIQE